MLVWLLLSMDHADKRLGDIRTRTTNTPPVTERVQPNCARMHAGTGTSPGESLLTFAKASTWVFFSQPPLCLKNPRLGRLVHKAAYYCTASSSLCLPHIWNQQYARWERRCDEEKHPGEQLVDRRGHRETLGCWDLVQWWVEMPEGEGKTRTIIK